ncbi:glycosyltransferase family 25 protein [Chitinophaga lutea]|nr:glycosyltransferase family 25 protein [Chitinophaga lutea]
MNTNRIKTFVISLKRRTDRRAHIQHEFGQAPEFDCTIVDAFEHAVGAKGLWQTIQYILNEYAVREEFVLICEDDHQFTSDYNKDLLFDSITIAMANNADVLSGGVSWLNSAVQVDRHIYWMEKFTGLQFVIIFKKFYAAILTADFSDTDVADHKISSLAISKYVIHPFISTQKEFGYSDVTSRNAVLGRVTELFGKSMQNMLAVSEVQRFYAGHSGDNRQGEHVDDGCCITTYVVNNGCDNIEKYIQAHFSDKPCFLPVVAETGVSTGKSHWQSLPVLKHILADAVANDEDVVIICDGLHRFTPAYSFRYLMKNILDAHALGADVLFGGANDFGLSVPISATRFWVGAVREPNFIVFFRSGISKLMMMPDGEISAEEGVLSGFSSNKMMVCPFVSASEPDTEKRLADIRKRYERHSTVNGNDRLS